MIRSFRREYSSPGVFLEKSFALPERGGFCTGVPLFLGRVAPAHQYGRGPTLITAWPQFRQYFGVEEETDGGEPGPFLACAVRGFFENDGERCYVLPIRSYRPDHIWEALELTSSMHSFDLVCIPGLVYGKTRQQFDDVLEAQFWILEHGTRIGGRFTILDTIRDAVAADAARQWSEMEAAKPGQPLVAMVDGAIYYPWLRVRGFDGEIISVPPSGHIAAVYARTDRNRGVHKAPANESLAGVVELEVNVTQPIQDFLNPKGINCIRSFPGRGIRVWGARTLSAHEQWRYVSTRRTLLTVVRWVQTHLSSAVFEPITPALWGRIERDIYLYLLELYRIGALAGSTPEQAFYVKCDEHTNPPEIRDLGEVVAEIGIATTRPFEFVVVRLIHGATGVSVMGQTQPWQPKSGE